MRFAVRGFLMFNLASVLVACSSAEPPAAPSRPVLVEHPQPVAGQSAEVFPGTVRAPEEADLAFRVPGKIASRRVSAGDEVKPGQVLATLDPSDAELNKAAAQAAASAAEADFKLADSEVTRHQELLDKGFISKSLYDVRVNARDLAKARYDQALSQLAVVQNQAGYTQLIADKAGVITAQLAETGQVVGAGQPVFRYATSGAREVLIYVPEGRLDVLRKAELSVTLWAQQEKTYRAKLREVNLQAERSTRTHEARVSIEGADAAVQLGMTATVVLRAEMTPGAFIVPLSALGGSKAQAVVWKVDEESKTRAVPVQVLRYLEQGAVIAGPLSADMLLVTAGTHLMVDGATVSTLPRQRKA